MSSEYRATVTWKRNNPDFDFETYSRDHQWAFPGGSTLGASAAADYKGNAALTNPEEVLAATLSGCHMLTFLALCARKRLVVDRYDDHPVAILDKNAEGKMGVTHITLRPKVTFGAGTVVTSEDLKTLHEKAHVHCFIANSLKCAMSVEPQSA